MKKLIIAFFATLLLSVGVFAQEEMSDEQRNYRRSSLCLILLTHSDKQYAEAMERVFRNFPLPLRYNEHNIPTLRVVSVTGKQNRKTIEELLTSNAVGQQVVGRWFNRNPDTGYMDMDLVHDRGGYSATYEDMQRAQSSVAGTDLLRDEGIELLQSTFVLVCDMDYIDKKKAAGWAAFGTGLLSAASFAMAAMSDVQASNAAAKGNYREAERKRSQATAWGAGAALGAAATAVVADIGGFRVKVNAYLYKLSWNDELTQEMYQNYWCSEDMDTQTSDMRKRSFNNARDRFQLEFVGKYASSSSKTILRSWKNEDEVILDVCHRCVNKSMKELAKKFAIFRPRAPFYFEGTQMFSHIGRKEDVTFGRGYEVIQPYKDKKGVIQYKKVGAAKAGKPWSNEDISFDDYFDSGEKGTQFYLSNCKVDAHTPGLLIREQ